ncbi:MAG: HNH endonuclease [Bacteriovoracaceae bacterium]|jgi:5-methylcytosine-specific restriction endonuclease McrA|nr:HNH endonuclease [Bacteriovoracaceae bacterium]
MTLFFGGRAQIIEEHATVKIKSPSKSYPLPKVIRLINNFKQLNYVKFTRENVFYRDNFTCAYCGQKFVKSELTMDHIVPKSRGGATDWLNIISSCAPCNNKKADRTPIEAAMPMLFKAYEPSAISMMIKKFSKKSQQAGFSHWFFEVG